MAATIRLGVDIKIGFVEFVSLQGVANVFSRARMVYATEPSVEAFGIAGAEPTFCVAGPGIISGQGDGVSLGVVTKCSELGLDVPSPDSKVELRVSELAHTKSTGVVGSSPVGRGRRENLV